MALQEGEKLTMRDKIRSEVRLQLHLPWKVWESDMVGLVDGGWQLERWGYWREDK